jgi:hypothetical protein
MHERDTGGTRRDGTWEDETTWERDYITTLQLTFLDGYMDRYLYRVYMERDYITTLQLTFLDGSIHGWIGT